LKGIGDVSKEPAKGSTPLEAVGQPVRNKRLLSGFTLIEISIVVAILAVAGAAAVWIGMGHAFI